MGIRVWFAASSVSAAIVLIIAAVADYRTEWRTHQLEYRERALAMEREFSVRELLKNMEIGIHQEYLEELGRVDRCVTCHLGIENPKMADVPQPLKSHPGFLLKSHPPQRFGCTICHGGQGLATDSREAHGQVSNWDRPLREPIQIEAACGTCHRQGKLDNAERLNEGRTLFQQFGCVGCHRVWARGLHVGPDLSRLAEKDFTGDHRVDLEDWEWNIQHLIDPRSKVQRSFMPGFGFDRNQATALAVFLYSLSDRSVAASYWPPDRPEIVPRSRIDSGYEVFLEYGCAGCHGVKGKGGVLNANSQSGGQVPALTKLREGYLKEALIQKIKEGARTEKADPKGINPPLHMPAWRGEIGDEKLDLLADYLFSLAPQTKDDWDE
ncbi:MAG TPA: c-type cytochrome [Bdellovibrionota bacterium]|nr:c-type cytochrome [Bdellovibrionota bacterium]